MKQSISRWTDSKKCRRQCRSLKSLNRSIMTTVFWLSSLIVCAIANQSISQSINQSDQSIKQSINDCYGVFELKGRRHYMEDSHAVYSSFHWHISQIATHSPFIHERSINQSINQSANQSISQSIDDAINHSPWISFAVFDGHGGHSASAFSAVNLLPHLHASIDAFDSVNVGLPAPEQSISQSINQSKISQSIDADVSIDQSINLSANQSADLGSVFTQSFLWLDEAYKVHPLSQHLSDQSINPHGDGSTALVASINLDDGRIIVANAGDCRALLIRDHRAVDQSINQSIEPLSACSTDSFDSSNTPSAIESEPESESEPSDEECKNSQISPANDSDAESELDDLDGDVEDEKTFAQTEAEIASMYAHFYPDHGDLIDPTMKRWINAANSRVGSSSSKRALQPPAKVSVPIMKGDYEPLSLDAKPHLPGEYSYVTSLPHGFVNRASPLSVSRVQGVLATSRAIGDYELKPWVRSEPHIVPYRMNSHSLPMYVDRWLLLASDGFFDVFTNSAVSRAIRTMQSQGLTTHQMARQLTIAAYKKGSFDNITVMIIDLACLKQAYEQHETHNDTSELSNVSHED